MNSVDPGDQVPPDPHGSARSVDVPSRELSKSNPDCRIINLSVHRNRHAGAMLAFAH